MRLIIITTRILTVVVALMCALFQCSSQEPSIKSSIWIEPGVLFAAAPSMKATRAEALSDGTEDYILYRYPFADPAFEGSLSLSLLVPICPSIRLSLGGSSDLWLSADPMYHGPYDPYVVLLRVGALMGVDGTLYETSEDILLFGAAHLAGNVFSGQVDGWSYRTNVTPTFRFGVEVASGVQYRLGSAWMLRLALSYAIGNLVGATFQIPQRSANGILESTPLNDGANPADPKDGGRVISAYGIRLGLGWSF